MPPSLSNGVLPLEWVSPVGQRASNGRVRYRGVLAAGERPLHLHFGFDGAGPPFSSVAMEREGAGTWIAEIPDAHGHVMLECAVATKEFDWDNNGSANYRLWIDLDPVDAHVHARSPGLEPMGFDSLRIALASAA